MCGIAGVTGPSSDGSNVAQQMINAIRWRGPDELNGWSNENKTVHFAHARLAIQDLSTAGSQPMISHCGNYHIIFNGEIYNHLALRNTIVRKWRGRSDTETLLELISELGLNSTLQLLNGMFAFAIYNKAASEITIVKDRFGEKPLYWSVRNNFLDFASDLTSLMKHPKFETTICPKALSAYLRFGYVPSPMAIFKNVFKLKPGSYKSFKINITGEVIDIVDCQYWNPVCAALSAQQNAYVDEADARKQIKNSLRNSVKDQTISDRPIGTFLSGGIDSTLITALLQEVSDTTINSFTIGFENKAFDEAQTAKKIAQHLGTNHSEMYLNEQQIISAITKIPFMYSEPFSDSSQIPTFLVSEFAKQDVTVALTGDGADELFGGYNRYTQGLKYWQQSQRIPQFLRHLSSGLITKLSMKQWDHIGDLVLGSFAKNRTPRLLGNKMHKLASVMKKNEWKSYYEDLVAIQNHPANLMSYKLLENNYFEYLNLEMFENISERLMLLDTMGYLVDDILVKVDRAAMYNSLETRCPYLSTDVYEKAWRLSNDMRVRDGKGKWILREILSNYVPSYLYEQPKMGFGIPIGELLLGPLRDWAESLLSANKLENSGCFDIDTVRNLWREHVDKKHNNEHTIWNILMFQAWWEVIQHETNGGRATVQ